MNQFVQRRKQELWDKGGVEGNEGGDIFTRLVAASSGTEKYVLDQQEVVRFYYHSGWNGSEVLLRLVTHSLSCLLDTVRL